MSEIKLFQTTNNQVTELERKSITIEKTLKTLIEKHLSEKMKEIHKLVKKVVG